MYKNAVTLYFLQSFQNWLAENFFFKTQVAPRWWKQTRKFKI